MLSSDLATLYGVDAKVLNQAVGRNLVRFPKDFMFQLNSKELENKMGWRKLPFVFTEQGAAMLSGVLNSKIAIAVNIQIIRIFIKMRETALVQDKILVKLTEIEKVILNHDNKINKGEEDIRVVFKVLK